jgi:hypothetical protein
MTYTIWSNAGRHEWIIRAGEIILSRSGLIYRSRAAAKAGLLAALRRAAAEA